MIKLYKFSMLLGAFALSSFFSVHAGYFCTNYPAQGIVPALYIFTGVGLGGFLEHVPQKTTLATALLGSVLVGVRAKFNTLPIEVGTKIVQLMLPLFWFGYWWHKQNSEPEKLDGIQNWQLKWANLAAAGAESIIQFCC